MIKVKKFKKAVTLLELVIVLALMAIVTMLVFNFVSLSQRKSSELDIKQELQHDGNMISESMMKNILGCKSIESVEGVNPSISMDNSIKSIKVNFNGKGELQSSVLIRDIIQIEYKLEGNKLNLYAIQESIATPNFVQTIAEDVKELKITNKNIVDELATKSLNHSDVKTALKKEKGINLEITLEKKGIPHTHTFELNLRNSN